MTCTCRSLSPLSVCLLGLLALGDVARAQDTAHVLAESRVRVVSVRPDGKPGRVMVQGKLLDLRGDTVHLGEEQGDVFHTVFDVPAILDSAHRLEVNSRSYSYARKGLQVGLSGGLAFAIVTRESCSDNGGLLVISCNDVTRRTMVAGFLALAGAAVGAMIGTAIVVDEWQPVPRPWAISPHRAQPRGVRLGLAIRC